MASRRAVSAALKMLALTFAGDVSGERVDLYAAALEDVDDGALAAATLQLVKTHKGEWIPVPAVIREAAGADVQPRADVEDIVSRISRLSEYNPHGQRGPRVGAVRVAMGDAIASAYGAVGGSSRLIDSTDATTRDIALRDFAKELEALVRERGPACLALPAPAVRLITGDAA